MTENHFSQKAKGLLARAGQAAMEMGHDYVGSEHLLMAMLREPGCAAGRLLGSKNVTVQRVVAQLKEMVVMGEATRIRPRGMTPCCRKLLEEGAREARRTGASCVGSEHLLMAMLRDSESVGGRVLRELGVDCRKSYGEIVASFGEQKREEYEPGGFTRRAGSSTPTLLKYGRDLTAAAMSGQVEELVGRGDEVDRMLQILSRRSKNNPCLIGEPGVGKTAIVEGLALRMARGEVPAFLRGRRLVALELSSMVAGAKYRGEFEDRLKNTMEEVRRAGDVILFIDELHTIVGAGAAEGAIDAANILKPTLARGEFRIIGATTTAEYRRYIEKDAALERRFQPVMVEEPSQEGALEILQGLRPRYEEHHGVQLSDEALQQAVELSCRYLHDRYLPDKAIDLMDEAASCLRLRECGQPAALQQLEQQVCRVEQEKEEAVRGQDFERAARARDREERLRKALRQEQQRWAGQDCQRPVVTGEDIAQVVARWTGIPVSSITQEERQRMLDLEKELKKQVIGQDPAVKAVVRAVRRGRLGIKEEGRPVGSFLFVGPTGVGKTALCRALARALFGGEKELIRLDMSEYMEAHSVSRLIGSPPGYVGFDEGGQLTARLRRHPYSVLLDEVEKAHPDVLHLLLQMLEDGKLTDSQGRTANLSNMVIILTSNVGARWFTQAHPLGFGEEREGPGVPARVMEEVRRVFPPELLGRMDEVVPFARLGREQLREISRGMAREMAERAARVGLRLRVEEDALDWLLHQGEDTRYGARPLRRTMVRMVEDRLAELLLTGEAERGEEVVVTVQENALHFQVTQSLRA
ncbi:MAG: ATP-dependent Clp protease ATP-binding subunit [Eubacteriales bacterium]